MARTRDMQRQRLYRSETAAANVLEMEHGVEFGWGSAPLPPADCQEYVNHVLRSAWLRKRYGTFKVNVRYSASAKRGQASYLHAEIRVAGKNPTSMTKRYLLHEVAHVINPDRDGHGPTFCATYLALTKHFLGKQQHDVLKAQMKALRIRFTPKVERPKRWLTEDQKDVLRARLEKARAVKTLKAAEREHEKKLAIYHNYWQAAKRAQDEGRVVDAARWREVAESNRLSANRLYEKIGNLKYALAKQERGVEDDSQVEDALRAAGITL